jgi:hypothetical protein
MRLDVEQRRARGVSHLAISAVAALRKPALPDPRAARHDALGQQDRRQQ